MPFIYFNNVFNIINNSFQSISISGFNLFEQNNFNHNFMNKNIKSQINNNNFFEKNKRKQ